MHGNICAMVHLEAETQVPKLPTDILREDNDLVLFGPFFVNYIYYYSHYQWTKLFCAN